MTSIKDLKLEQKSLMQQQQVVAELNTLVKDIERSEKIILDLQTELNAVNTKYPIPRTTRQDVAYLTDLLKCANKKLAWEKQIASMQKAHARHAAKNVAVVERRKKSAHGRDARADVTGIARSAEAAMARLQELKTSEEGNITSELTRTQGLGPSAQGPTAFAMVCVAILG